MLANNDHGAPVLHMTGIHKSFFGVKVLDDVSLMVDAGQVLALLGENGAGKSTLIKILNGDYQKDAGDIFIDGEPMEFNEPRDAEAQGIRMIYQELHYAPELSVAENMLLGNLPRRKGFMGRYLVNWREMYRITRERLSLLNLNINPESKMRDLPIVERQIVEIVKALSAEARIIVMDEPTAALTPNEVNMLFDVIRELKQRGVAIIYISHRLDEIFQIADQVMVLRDGRHVDTKPVGDVTMSDVVVMMVGREIEERQQAKSVEHTADSMILEVRNMTRYGTFEDVTFEMRAGEILGIFGLIGSGQIPLTRSIFGAEPLDDGQIFIDGREVTIKSPQDAREAGVGFVPIDRKVRALIMGQSVRKNITLSNWGNLASIGFFRQKQERAHATNWINALGIRMAGGMEVPIRYLSGGNQQKVVLARWLEANVKILILNEPTWGVDVGARSDIYDQLEKLAAQGLAVLIVSSDIQEILTVSHRILTMHRGQLTAEFTIENANQDSLLNAAAGATI